MITESDRPIFQGFNKFCFIFVLSLIVRKCFCLAHWAHLKFILATSYFQHLSLNSRKIFVCYCISIEIHIIIESTSNGRPYGKLDIRIKFLQSLG